MNSSFFCLQFSDNFIKNKQCYTQDTLPGNVCGTIRKGKFKGSSRLTFNDGSHMQVYLKSNVIHGTVYIYNKESKLVAFGRYKNGFPNGPFWLINHHQYAQIQFQNGTMSREVLWINKAQCGNFMIFQSFRFYVKSILGILEVQNLPFQHI